MPGEDMSDLNNLLKQIREQAPRRAEPEPGSSPSPQLALLRRPPRASWLAEAWGWVRLVLDLGLFWGIVGAGWFVGVACGFLLHSWLASLLR